MLKFKFKILFFFIFFAIVVNCIAQEIPNPYTPKHWESFTELPNHLTDTTNYIGRLYQYSDQELYFKDSNTRLQKISDKEVYHPACYGAIGDGITDDTGAFIDMAADLPTDSVINLMNKTYYLNTSGGVTFANRVNIVGPGKFTVGTGVGNAPAITISGARSYLADFEIVGDHTNFTNTALSTELRRSIKITADYVTCERLKDTNSIVGIELNTVSYCTIQNCISVNDIIVAGMAANNYNAGFYLAGAQKCKIIGNFLSGHGNPILHGGTSFYNIINNNQITNADNNGIYVSSGQWIEICGNIIRECDGNGIKARDSYHLVCNNLVDQNSATGGLIGIGFTGNGTGDVDNFNGENTIVIGNIVRGQYTAGIRTNAQDGAYFRNPHIVGNTVELEGDANLALYGIQIKGRSQNAIVTNNIIKNSEYGIYFSTDDPNIDFHRNALVSNNNFYDNRLYAILVNEYDESAIKNNTFYDSGQYVIKATNSDNVDISDNYIEDFYHSISSNYAITVSGINNTVKNNYIERTNIGGYSYGLRVEYQSQNMSIIGNTFKNCDYGIWFVMSDSNTDYHHNAIISDNLFVDSNNGGIYGTQLNFCTISNNNFYNAGTDPIELTDSNCIAIINNIIEDDQAAAIINYGITVKGSSFEIIGNLIKVLDSAGNYGIQVYGDGGADSDNYNGYNSVIKDNHIIGPWGAGIFTGADGGYYPKNTKIIGNTIEIKTGGAYGIRIDGRSSGASIVNNNITGHSIGIFINIDDPNVDTHSKMLIKGNDTSNGTNDGINLSYVKYSLITDNISMNAAANMTGMALSNCEYNQVINNLCGDDQETPTQKFGIEELGASDYNHYINNDSTGVVTREYIITGSNSVVSTDRVLVETLSGHKTFVIGEAKTYIIDPGGAGRNFNPIAVTWPMINELILVNTADNAETITFDSAGLNQAVAQNERGIFVYDGSNWLKVYVGS